MNKVSYVIHRNSLAAIIVALLFFTQTAPALDIFADTGIHLGTWNCCAIAFGDVDGDGDLDVGLGNNQSPDVIYINDGTGNFAWNGQNLGTSYNFEHAQLLDMDGDGDLDFVTGGYHGVAISYNNGDGFFGYVQQLPPIPGLNIMCCVAADFDGDGDGDLACACRGGGYYYENMGDSTFTPVANGLLDTQDEANIFAADVDNDGDLDISVRNAILYNDGAGNFINSGQDLGVPRPWGRQFGDLDSDGDLDLVIGHIGGPDYVFYNDGTGFFQNSGYYIEGYSYGVALADVDLDADLDIATSNWASTFVYLNEGGGVFDTIPTQTLSAYTSYGVALGDVNGDGLPDLAQSRVWTSSRIFLNILPAIISATIDINPNVLNLSSHGRWVTCYIELPQEFAVEDIDTSTVAITRANNMSIDPLPREGPVGIGDHDENGIPDLMVKFDRQALSGMLNAMVEPPTYVELTVTGQLIEGRFFEGADSIRAIAPGGSYKDPRRPGRDSTFVYQMFGLNPVSAGVNFGYTLQSDEFVSILVYDASGRLVTTLLRDAQQSGSYTVQWDCRGIADQRVNNGVYFLRFEAGEYKETVKFIVIR
ncbi:MAG: VCBS repeat-containing protein [candidate division WOR-3 bacterium]|nr:MAG: VCBS repeat-containing protein [candidate division WOR-3 bacterium]